VDIPLIIQVGLTPGANDEIPIASGFLLTPRSDRFNIVFEVGVYRKIAPTGQKVEEFRSFINRKSFTEDRKRLNTDENEVD